MKWVVYTLLALNLGLLTWNLQGQATAPDPEARPVTAFASSDEERAALPLLSELDGSSLRSRPTGVAAAAAESGAAAPDAAMPAVPEPAEPPGPAVPPAEASKPAQAVPELATAPVAAAPAPQPAPTPSAGARSGAQTCLTLGPLEDKAAIPAIRTWLEERGAEVDVRTDERREVALYWVFFPPRATREAAIEEVVRMKEQGIDDVIVVPRGDMANAISLGVYSRPEFRDRRLRELNAKGYQPSIGPRYRTKVASWVDVAVDSTALETAAVEARFPEIRVTPTPCPGAPAGTSAEAPAGVSAETGRAAPGGSAEAAPSGVSAETAGTAAGDSGAPSPPPPRFSRPASEQ